MPDLTIQDLAMTDQIAGVENARRKIHDGPKVQGLTMTDQLLEAFGRQL